MECVEIATEGNRNEQGIAAAVIRELWHLRWCDIARWTIHSPNVSALRALAETPDAVQSAYENMREVFHQVWLDATYPGYEDRVMARQEDGMWWVSVEDIPGCHAAAGTLPELWDAWSEALVTFHAGS